jgi:hypothetical protein
VSIEVNEHSDPVAMTDIPEVSVIAEARRIKVKQQNWFRAMTALNFS